VNSTCVGGAARKLVEARFVRPLLGTERERLEHHLGACAFCSERYRRLQLAERVAARGPGAIDEPSPAEIERIAFDLGLAGDGSVASDWGAVKERLLGLLGGRGPLAALAGVLALVLLLIWVRPPRLGPEDGLVPRGEHGANAVSFQLYVVAADGSIRLNALEQPVSAADHLKLRASWTGEAPLSGAIEVYLVPHDGAVRRIRLEAPARASSPGGAAVASVPGAVGLDGMPGGRAKVVVVAGPEHDLSKLLAEAPDLDPAALAARAGPGTSVERFEIEVRAP
jgi:hypothetical protein